MNQNKIPYNVTTELAYNPSFNLSRDDIYNLGFLRSNPSRFIYQHKDNPRLYLEEKYEYNVSSKDLVDELVEVRLEWSANNLPYRKILFNSNVVNKDIIEKIVKDNI